MTKESFDRNKKIKQSEREWQEEKERRLINFISGADHAHVAAM